jgi:hypothetical protein
MNLTVSIFICLSFLGAIGDPFTTYAFTLSCFGIPHVILELRYLRHRFHHHWHPILERSTLILLAFILTIRALSFLGIIPTSIAYTLELMCGLGLILIATYHLYQSHHPFTLIGFLLAILLGFGILHSPLTTLLIIAILHNLTPIGFILDRLRLTQGQSISSRSTKLSLFLIFVILPLTIVWIQTHFPAQTHPHLSAFLPIHWQTQPIAYPLFSAITYLQCLHYTLILGLFPQWTPIAPKAFYAFVILIALTFWVSFQTTFPFTRAIYSIPAALHAWIEIPILLLLLHPQQPQSQPIGHPIRPDRQPPTSPPFQR